MSLRGSIFENPHVAKGWMSEEASRPSQLGASQWPHDPERRNPPGNGQSSAAILSDVCNKGVLEGMLRFTQGVNFGTSTIAHPEELSQSE